MQVNVFEILQYGFIQRAFVAGAFVAILCSTLGVFLVLRRLSLIGDGLAHATFGGVAIGLFFNITPLYAALPVVMLGSLGILKLTQRTRVYGDAAIGIIAALGIAGGVLLASLSQGFNVDLFSYLFGNILAISREEVVFSIILSVVVILMIVFSYYDLLSVTFDEEFAHVSGIDTKKINAILVLLTSLAVVLSMKVVGILLVSSLLILPAVTALQLAKGFRTTIVVAATSALLSVIAGITISLLANLPAGATIVMFNLLLFLIALVYKKTAKKLGLSPGKKML